MKNILSEISQQEKNRILEMHKSASANHYLSEQETTVSNQEPVVGHLTGDFTVDLGEMMVDPSKNITWEWTINNTGKGPISIKEVKTSFGAISDPSNIQTIQPNESGNIKVTLKMEDYLKREVGYDFPGQKDIMNGLLEFDMAVLLITENGRKKKYQLNAKADFKGKFIY
jgi:hypothetical protein